MERENTEGYKKAQNKEDGIMISFMCPVNTPEKKKVVAKWDARSIIDSFASC